MWGDTEAIQGEGVGRFLDPYSAKTLSGSTG
jgi:hypothetical protein